MKTYVVKAAGGNATAVNVCNQAMTESWYREIGQKQLQTLVGQEVEQVGFFIKTANQFQMSGGEFCGNGTRAAGLVCAIETGILINTFLTSGFDGPVTVDCRSIQMNETYVTGRFPGLDLVTKQMKTSRYGLVDVIDMEGIVHIIIPAMMPENYIKIHKEICTELGMLQRAAVGVDWISSVDSLVARLDPVVWVPSINSYFYESACGSGSMAVAKACGVTKVLQPSGEIINVEITKDQVSLGSEMRVTYIN